MLPHGWARPPRFVDIAESGLKTGLLSTIFFGTSKYHINVRISPRYFELGDIFGRYENVLPNSSRKEFRRCSADCAS